MVMGSFYGVLRFYECFMSVLWDDMGVLWGFYGYGVLLGCYGCF